jgi:hypothetical protein
MGIAFFFLSLFTRGADKTLALQRKQQATGLKKKITRKGYDLLVSFSTGIHGYSWDKYCELPCYNF